MRDGVHKNKQLKFVAEMSFAPVRARAMVLVDFISPSPRCRCAALPSDAGDCQSLFVAARAVGGLRWRSSLLKLLLLTRQAAEHGAVEPRRNELPSFRARRGLSIVPIKSTTGPRLLLDSTALHCSAGCQPKPAPRKTTFWE